MLDSKRARELGKRSGKARRRKAAEKRAKAEPSYPLTKRWPTPPDIIEFVTHRDLLGLAISPAQA